MNDSENIPYQNLWDATREVLSGQFPALKAYIWKEGRLEINDLSILLKKQKYKRSNKKDKRRNQCNSKQTHDRKLKNKGKLIL